MQTGMGVFTVLGGVFVVALVGFWITVALRTLAGAYRGHLFVAPCLVTGNMLPRGTNLRNPCKTCGWDLLVQPREK